MESDRAVYLMQCFSALTRTSFTCLERTLWGKNYVIVHRGDWKYFTTPLAFRFDFIINTLSIQASALLFTHI